MWCRSEGAESRRLHWRCENTQTHDCCEVGKQEVILCHVVLLFWEPPTHLSVWGSTSCGAVTSGEGGEVMVWSVLHFMSSGMGLVRHAINIRAVSFHPVREGSPPRKLHRETRRRWTKFLSSIFYLIKRLTLIPPFLYKVQQSSESIKYPWTPSFSSFSRQTHVCGP